MNPSDLLLGVVSQSSQFVYAVIDFNLDEAANLVVYSGQDQNVVLSPRLVRDCQDFDWGKEVLVEESTLLVRPCKASVL